MWKPFEFIYHAICEDLWRPMTLLRLIDEHSDMRKQLIEPKPVISASGVVQWQDWGIEHWGSLDFSAITYGRIYR